MYILVYMLSSQHRPTALQACSLCLCNSSKLSFFENERIQFWPFIGPEAIFVDSAGLVLTGHADMPVINK